jgi:hypothetical protein
MIYSLTKGVAIGLNYIRLSVYFKSSEHDWATPCDMYAVIERIVGAGRALPQRRITPFQGLTYAWTTDIHRALLCAVDARALPLCAPATTRPVNAVETHGVRLPSKKYNHAGGNTNVPRGDARQGDARHGDARRASLHCREQHGAISRPANNHKNHLNHSKITVQTTDDANVLRRDAKFCVSTNTATNIHKNQSNHTKITVQTIDAIKSRQSSESELSELTEFSGLYCSHSQFCSFSNSVNPDSDIHKNQSNHAKITVQTTGAIKSRQSSESEFSELTEFSGLYCRHNQFCSFSNSVNPDSDIHKNHINHPKITVQTNYK